MSGKQLVNKLEELKFPGVETLHAPSLDWMCEDSSLSPILDWFCQNVTASNVLEPKELEEYKELSSSGEIILTGRQLEEALSHLPFTSEESVTEETLRDEIQQLSSTLEHYNKKKKRLAKRRNLLSNHHASQSHRLSKLAAVEAKAQHHYKKVLEQTHTDNKQVNDSLAQLTQAVDQFSELYSQPVQPNAAGSYLPSQGRPASPAMFLSQAPMQQYYSMEEDFTTKLTLYTKKQFFEGIADMASSGEESRYEILNISDPDSLLVRGESEDVNVRDCKELARLQELYDKSETQAIQSQSEVRKMKAQIQCAEDILQSLKTGAFCLDCNKNKERLQKLQSTLQAARRDHVQVANDGVPRLIQKCKDAKVLRVLTGDYNLKLARQDYFTSNQDKVIHQLIMQRSRNEFMTMALEVELRRHRELHHILTSVHTLLQRQFQAWQERMTVMGDNSLSPARHKRETVDSRDKSTARLYSVLDPSEGSGEEKQLFLSFSALIENARRVQQQHASLTSSVHNSLSGRQDRLQLLESNLTRCKDLVYAGSSTTVGQPTLTPRQIQDTIAQLRDMLQKLEQGIMDIVREFETKKKMLRSDKLLVQERNLFLNFFTNPSKLLQSLEHLSTRLQAEKHVDSKAGEGK